MPLIVCLHRCAARHGAGTRSIAFCSASATTWPTSRPGSRPTSRARSWPPSTASAVENNENSSLFDLFSATSADTVCREVGWALFSAAQPKSARRGHRMHRARPPAPRFLLRRPPGPFFCLSASTSRLLCAKPTAPTHLDEDATHGTHVPAKKLAVITADTETIISRASGAGRLAWFGFGFRVAGSVQWACQKARGIYGALVTKLDRRSRLFALVQTGPRGGSSGAGAWANPRDKRDSTENW